MSLFEIGGMIFGPTEGIIEFLRRNRLLARNMDCDRCGVAMRERPRKDVSDGVSWACPQCKTRKSVREGSFFKDSRLSLKKWLIIMHWWARQYPVTDAAEEAQVNSGTAVDAYQWLREVCTTKLLGVDVKLGGQGTVVQIDESLFRHKPKYNRGRRAADPVWVFGMVDTSEQPALGYMEVVAQRNAATLLPIIQDHVLPGTIVHSDEWAAYNRVAGLPGVAGHDTVNHSVEFVSPGGVHTQNVESYWNRVKTKLKRMRGCHSHQLPSYLDEFMWRERFGKTAISAFQGIMGDIALQYPV